MFLVAFQFRHNSHASSIETSMLGHLISNHAIPTYKFFCFPLATIDSAFSLGHTADLLKLESYRSYYVVLHAHVKHFKLVGAGLHVAYLGGQIGKKIGQNQGSLISYTTERYDFNLTDILEVYLFLILK